MLGLKCRKHEVYYFYVEVKRPFQESKYQPESDFTKLMKLMKSSINAQLHYGFSEPFSLGLFCEGNTEVKYSIFKATVDA